MPLNHTFTPPKQNKRYGSYRQEELTCMTVMQLRDICEREEIVHPSIDRMAPGDLIHLILQFRGSRTPKLILSEIPGGQERLEAALKKVRKREKPHNISIPAKIVAYQGLDTNCFDGYTLPYSPALNGVNVVVLDNEDSICAILQVQTYVGQDMLYLTRSGELPCRTASVKAYRLLLFTQEFSDMMFEVYAGTREILPPETHTYSVPLLDFLVLEPTEATMPLVIDFGTSNTAAGAYIDQVTFQRIKDGVRQGQVAPESVNYVRFFTPDGQTAPIVPTVIGVHKIESGRVEYNIGYDTEKNVMNGYAGESFCVFYDIKRWVSDYDREEELSDSLGNRILVKRKEIIRAFLLHVIESAQQQFKCLFKSVCVSYPVKQKARFLNLYREILSEYAIAEEMIDEGVSVLYSTIGMIIDQKRYTEGEWYQAMIVDCGGGTTDLSTCRFSIKNERVAYNVRIESAYENGDTDFGGNNLTYRIFQLLKVAAAREISGAGATIQDIAMEMDGDIYSVVESQGANGAYKPLDDAYAAAEEIIPTRFKDYEYSDRGEYYMVRNNFYFLFTLAERVKKEFFGDPRILRVTVGSQTPSAGDSSVFILAPRWKLAAAIRGRLTIQKLFPAVSLNTALVKAVLHADIYDITYRFFDKLYISGELNNYQIINLTGQSCKIDIFRDSLKEYLPGKLIRGRPGRDFGDYRLKLTCLDGAIRYITDRRLGYAKVTMESKTPALPYELRALTHSGEEVTLIRPLDHMHDRGGISRSMNSVELRLHLLNTRGEERHIYSIICEPESFKSVTYEDISTKYGENIPQTEVDAIVNGEVRYFIWLESGAWGFSVTPVLRNNDQLRIGSQQVLPFENESWMVNYFDGTW